MYVTTLFHEDVYQLGYFFPCHWAQHFLNQAKLLASSAAPSTHFLGSQNKRTLVCHFFFNFWVTFFIPVKKYKYIQAKLHLVIRHLLKLVWGAGNVLVCPVCFNSTTCFSGSAPSTGNCNPCSNQDQSFTKECLNSVSWDFASLHSFQMLNTASSQPLYFSQVCSIHIIIAGEKKKCPVMLQGDKEKEEKKYQARKEWFFGVNLSKYRSLINDEMDFFVPSYIWGLAFPNKDSSFYLRGPKPPPLVKHAGNPPFQT